MQRLNQRHQRQMITQPPEVPANYFGRGRDFILPDDTTVVAEITEKWTKYEQDHPDDPMGENILKKWEEDANRLCTVEATKNLQQARTIVSDYEFLGVTTQLRLELPKDLINHLKGYARYTRKRPRTIIEDLIKTLKYPGGWQAK